MDAGVGVLEPHDKVEGLHGGSEDDGHAGQCIAVPPVHCALPRRRAAPDLQARLWSLASLYPVPETLAKGAAVLGRPPAELAGHVERCLALVGAAAPGSDMHVQMAAR